MTFIIHLRGREILDSRGFPTVEAEIVLDDGSIHRASVPSGASTGSHEAHELRDGDERYRGRGVRAAVAAVNGEIADLISGFDPSRLLEIDALMGQLDGHADYRRLGANAVLATSLAVARAAAARHNQPLYRWCGGGLADLLPVPLMNVINGGAHADNRLAFQEFMIVPVGAPCFSEALRMGSEVFHALKQRLGEKGLSVAVGDEGGFAPAIESADMACDFLLQAIEQAGYRVGDDVALALDIAAGEFHAEDGYAFDGGVVPASRLIECYAGLLDRYPIISIEDPLGEDDWDGWGMLMAELGTRCQWVGDDLFVTNIDRLQRGIDAGIANAILIKPNQIGTVSQTFATLRRAQHCAYGVIMSHRSGETEDDYIADFAVGAGCGQIKAGSLSRSERLAKYNRLLRIEAELGSAARYAGRAVFGRR